MWLDQQVSLYTSHSDNTGRAVTLREILLSDFAKNNPVLKQLQGLDKNNVDYKKMKLEKKAKLPCYTPAALLATKAAGKLTEISRTGIMQLDFDHSDIKEYDIEELKQCIFELPFIGFCGLSCSGDGFYALALIAEPDKLAAYAEHCFETLATYGLRADTSKGKKVENLRYLSYDQKMLVRENPEPLLIEHFRTKPVIKSYAYPAISNGISNTNKTVQESLERIKNVQVGSRWQTVQQVAYYLGGIGNYLQDLKQAINDNSAFNGEEKKYFKCADDCFNAGIARPITNNTNGNYYKPVTGNFYRN